RRVAKGRPVTYSLGGGIGGYGFVVSRPSRWPDPALHEDPDFAPALERARGGRAGVRAYRWAPGGLRDAGARAAAVAVPGRPAVAMLELPGYQVRASLIRWAGRERAELWEWFRRRDQGWRPT